MELMIPDGAILIDVSVFFLNLNQFSPEDGKYGLRNRPCTCSLIDGDGYAINVGGCVDKKDIAFPVRNTCD